MNKEVKRIFLPGSEWLYYKLYCGINTADSIITGVLIPMSVQLRSQGVIDKWFFIRYHDPEQHLRVRFHMKDQNSLGFIMSQIHEALESYVASGLVWNIQIDTYKRELERYGKNTIKILESYFYFDSELIARIIKESHDEENRFQNAFHYLNAVVNLYLPSYEKRFSFLDKMQLSFKKEFHINSIGRKQLGKKYRDFSSKLEATNPVFNDVDLHPIILIISKIKGLEEKSELEVSSQKLLGSMIHMTINRMFQSRQRFYEMTLYDFLFHNNKSEYLKDKQKAISN